MAKSGYKEYAVNTDIKLKFSWTAGDYSISNNYTPVTWILTIQNTSSTNKISSQVNKSNVTKIDDVTLFNDEVSINCNPGITRTLISGVRNIYHNTNGTKTFTFEVNQYFGPVYYPNTNTIVDLGTKTFTGSGTLDAIPRPSVLGTISNFTIGNTIAIPTTKYTSNISDTLNIYVGDTWIKRIEGFTNGQTINQVVNKSVTFTSSEISTIYNAMPNVTNATFRVVNSTYNGANVIGTSTKTVTGSIANTVKPSISSVSLVEAVSGLAAKFGAYVQSKSKISGTVSASAGSGSSIDSYNIKINGVTYTSGTFTTDELKTSGSNSCVVTVTDKRGRTAASTTTFNVVAYASPFISNITIVRSNSDGTPNDNGSYVRINATATITSISNNNNKTFKLEYKLRSASSWTTNQTYTSSYTYTLTNKIVSNINPDQEYDFRISAQDYFVTNTNQVPLSSGYTILDINATGKGLAVGKVSSKNALQIGMEVYDRFDTRIWNGLSFYESGGVTNVNTTLDELVLSSTNTPTSDFWYVRTMFYSTKSVTTNRTQIAYPYNKNLPIYCRYYINGSGWSIWKSANIKEMSLSETSGYIWYANGELRQFGKAIITPTAANTITSATITFAKSFDTVLGANIINVSGYPNAITNNISSVTTTTIKINITRTTTVATAVLWEVTGYKNPI